ncbi:CD2-associated protein-like isoform X2 [Tigriopus californicus]|uniref:CD2-associated protein-like isoform X2 n=1 Tax=Tigriopus californicus TaxID=6832 RepID=UPI0027DA819C|nr:CD2-associated protein-like isoform X2 [Tigriopus californicus]
MPASDMRALPRQEHEALCVYSDPNRPQSQVRVYQVNKNDPRLYCQCAVHRKQKQNVNNHHQQQQQQQQQRRLGSSSSPVLKRQTSLLSLLSLKSLNRKSVSRCSSLKTNEPEDAPPQTSRFSSSVKLLKPFLSLDYSKKRWAGSCDTGLNCDHIVHLRGFQRRGTVYHNQNPHQPLRTSASTSTLLIGNNHLSLPQEIATTCDRKLEVVSKSDMKAQQKPSLSLSSSVDDGLNDDESDDIDSEVKLRPKLQTSSSKSGPIAKRQCRVLFSYAPAHEDELELQMDEVIDFLGEVEDGWWRGALNGKTGVFPSNFVEMVNSPGTGEPSLKTPPAVENILESKNKKNDPNLKEPARVDIVEASRAKISNLIQEAESKAKPGRLPISAFENKPSNSASPKKEAQSRPSFALGLVASLGGGKTNVTPVSAVNTVVIENHNLLKKSTKPASNDPAQHPLKGAERRQSPLGRESNPDLKNSTSSTSSNNVSNISAPRLPPKPVKEQCVVQFPYTALNEDELTLAEGQVVSIITKEVEDKGWWKGELEGKVGVFPDNFVKLLPSSGTNTTNGSFEELGVKAPNALKKPQRPPGSPTLKSNQQKKSGGGGGSSSTQNARQMERKLSSTSSSMDENSRGSREQLDEPDVSLPAPKKVITSSVRERSKRLFNTSKDNLNSGPDSSKRNSFGKANPPPRPKPPSASAKPVASTPTAPATVANIKPISSTFNKVTAAVTSKLAGSVGHKAQGLPSSANRHQSLPVTAQETMGVLLDNELDCVERNERLAHPTAGRAKAPKRRPPSSIFVKEADVLGGLTNGSHSSSSSDSLQKQKSNEDLTKASPPKDSVKMASAKKQPPPKPPVSVSATVVVPATVLTTANPENNKGERIIAPKVEETEKPFWLEELSRKQANRKSLLKEQQHNNHPSHQSNNSSGINSSEHASNKSKENEAPTDTNNHGAPLVPENKPVIPVKPSQIKDDVSSRKSIFLSSVKRPSSLTNHPNPEPKSLVTTTTTGSIDLSSQLAHTPPASSSTSSSTTCGSTTSVTTSCSSTTSSVTSSPEKVPQNHRGSLEKPLVSHVETNPKVVSKESKAADNDTHRPWTKSSSVKIEDSKRVKKTRDSVDNGVLAAKPDSDLDDLEKLALIDRVRRLEEVVKMMELTHKSEMSNMMSELQTERETRSNLEKELERFIRTSSIV